MLLFLHHTQTFGERRSKERRSELRSLNRERNVNGRSVFRWGTGKRTEWTSFWKGTQTERQRITSAFLFLQQLEKDLILHSKALGHHQKASIKDFYHILIYIYNFSRE